jgi:hypothetical protein
MLLRVINRPAGLESRPYGPLWEVASFRIAGATPRVSIADCYERVMPGSTT